jgi:anthranilate synthase component 1
MMQTPLSPSFDEFLRLAGRGNVVPVFAEFVADAETPVSAFQKLCHAGDYGFLFESTEKNDVSGRFSFVGTEPRAVFRSHGRQIKLFERGRERCFETSSNPLDEVRTLLASYRFAAQPELTRFAGGAVGFIGYEAINFFEPTVSVAANDELRLPEMLFMITDSILIFDHRLRSLKVVVNAFLDDGPAEEVYARVVQSIEAMVRKLAQPAKLTLLPTGECNMPAPGRDAALRRPVDAARRPYRSNFRREEFECAVDRAKEYIRAGDIFQVVLSQRFESDFAGDPLNFYRCLRFINPSPYMFCLNFGDDFALVGSSPEMHVRLTGDTVEIRPIAGTRRRGGTASEDEANARELLADPKERAEHIMLVDLARNDVGRIAEFGSA